MRHLPCKRFILRLAAALMLALVLPVGVSCNAPAIGEFYMPIPPPDPTIGQPTSETDSDGIAHTYWKVTSPPSFHLSESWVYLTNIDMGRGVSVQAAQDGSYTTQIEGQQGDQIIISVQAPDIETICRPLREGLANVACQ
jgi:hypothetical protein